MNFPTKLESFARSAPPRHSASAGAKAISYCTQAMVGCVRVVGLRDQGHFVRLDWLGDWIEFSDTFVYDEGNSRILSQLDCRVDCMVLHGNDPRRMSKIIRSWREIFPGKTILAMLSDSGPTARAELFRSGADCVVDLRTPVAVACAMLAALAKQRDSLIEHDEPTLPVVECAQGSRLSPSESLIVGMLQRFAGRIVPYSRLLRAVHKPVTSCSIRTLQVQVSSIKRKLAKPVSIVNERGEGYRLVVDELA